MTTDRVNAAILSEVEFVATIRVDLRAAANDDDRLQAVQDKIGYTGAQVIEITYVEGATE